MDIDTKLNVSDENSFNHDFETETGLQNKSDLIEKK